MERRSFFKMLGAVLVAPVVAKETFVPSDSSLYGIPACETNAVCGEWAGISRDHFYGGAAGGGKTEALGQMVERAWLNATRNAPDPFETDRFNDWLK